MKSALAAHMRVVDVDEFHPPGYYHDVNVNDDSNKWIQNMGVQHKLFEGRWCTWALSTSMLSWCLHNDDNNDWIQFQSRNCCWAAKTFWGNQTNLWTSNKFLYFQKIWTFKTIFGPHTWGSLAWKGFLHVYAIGTFTSTVTTTLAFNRCQLNFGMFKKLGDIQKKLWTSKKSNVVDVQNLVLDHGTFTWFVRPVTWTSKFKLLGVQKCFWHSSRWRSNPQRRQLLISVSI